MAAPLTQLTMQVMVGVARVELAFSASKAEVIAVIRHPNKLIQFCPVRSATKHLSVYPR